MRTSQRIILVLCVLTACSPLISIFDETAYKNGIDLKVDFQFLVQSSGEPYTDHKTEVTDYLKKLHKAYEHEKGRDKNNLTLQQYEILMSADGPILSYFNLWREGEQSEYFRKEVLEQSAQIFDELLKLEHAKRREGIKLNLTDPDSQQTK